MGHEGVLLGQAQAELAVLAVDKPVSKLVLTFAAPGQAEFGMGIDGQVTPAQLFAVVARLARIERRQFAEASLALPDDPPTLSRLVFEFEGPGSAEFSMVVDGRVTVGQLDVAERWLSWKTETDFAISLQANLQQQMRNQQVMSQIGQRGLGRTQ